MDNFVGLFTRTEGRISRKSWWLGTVILIVINIIISLIALPLVGVSMMPDFAAMTANPDTAAQGIADSMRAGAWASLILFAIFAYPIYALSLKRRYDKDNNGMDLKIYLGLIGLLLLIQAIGIGMETTTVGGLTIPTPSMWLMLLSFAIGIYAIYLLVVLGFLNQYGPDPLGGTAAAAA